MSYIYINTEECNNLNTSLNIVIVTKSRRLRFMGNAAYVERRKFSAKILVVEAEEKEILRKTRCGTKLLS
jgi:hypothetical protein